MTGQMNAYPEEQEENEEMVDNGGLNANTAATLALLADTSRAGRGNMYGGGYGEGGGFGNIMFPGNSMLAAGAHADGTATKTAIDCHFNASGAALDRLSDQNEENRRISQNDRLNKNISDSEFRTIDKFNGITDRITNSEFRSLDRQRDIEKTLANMAAKNAECCCDTQKAIAEAAAAAAKCCCEAQLQACKDHAELSALVIQENSKTRELIRGDALAAANAKIVQLETINALSDHHHRS